MVVAIELLAACQALDLSRPLKTTPRLEAVYDLVRSHVKPWDGDRYMAPDLDVAVNLIRTGQVMQAASPTGDLKWGDEGPHY